VDSDTVSYSDLNQLINDFARSHAVVALVEDLVTSKPNFRARWSAATGSTNMQPFVPQTALMLFKKTGFSRLLPTWESIWRKWIEPVPFAYYGDPDPAFHGSAFCIEQYALGLALEQLNMLSDGSLFVIPRREIIFKDVGPNGNVGHGQAYRLPFSSLFAAANPHQHVGPSSYAGSSSYTLGSASTSGSVVIPSGGVGSYSLGSLQFGSGLQSSAYAPLTSYQILSGSYQLGSYQLTGATAGSYQLGSAQLASNSYQLGSYQLPGAAAGSYQLGSAQLIGSYHLSSGQVGSSYFGSYPAGGSFAASESLRVNEALDHTQGSIGIVHVNSGLNYDIVVDSFAGSLLHFYSFNYEPGFKIYQANAGQIKETLKTIWTK